MKKLVMAILAAGVAGSAFAKLPPLSDEAKAKAEEAKAKSAWNDKVSAYKLCLTQDRVAAAHLKAKGDAAKVVTTPACQDPGPFVAATPAAAPAAPAAQATATPAVAQAPGPVAAPAATAEKK